jgi:predicted methyltransferase
MFTLPNTIRAAFVTKTQRLGTEIVPCYSVLGVMGGVGMPIVLSHFQARPLLAAREAGRTSCAASPDLGLTTVDVVIQSDGALFPDGAVLAWPMAEEIADSENACFTLENGCIEKIQTFSDDTNRFCSLMPTQGAPTLLLAGFPMHRIKDTDPHQDTLSKIKAVAPVVGRVLDTATGLGYTAIEACRTAEEVITIELDPAVLEIARLNPWSRALFENPKITQMAGDSFDVIEEFEDASFTRVIHDPPTFSLAGELYSGAFYGQLFRVMRRGGRLFHYIGDLDRGHGQRVARGAMRRLQEAGFNEVRPYPRAFGLVAHK